MIKAYKYGLLDPVAGFDQIALDVLYLRKKLWNALVELERGHRQRYRDLLTESDAELASIQSHLVEIEAARVDLVSRKKQARAKVRSKQVDTSELDLRIDALISERRLLSAKAKEIRATVKENIKPAIAELEKERYNAVKRLTHESGLWWGNHETVVEAYDVARVKAMKENTELRFRSFDGTGKFAVRNKTGGFPLSDLTTGKLSFARLEALPDENFTHLSMRGKQSRARHNLTLRILTYKDELGKLQSHEVTWPIILHRPLPDGTIKCIHVQRKRVGKEFKWSCSITMEIDGTQKSLINHPSPAACGIDLGYRLVKDGLRVATLATTESRVKHLVLPQDWLDRMDHVDNIHGWVSEQNNLAWEKLRGHLGSIQEYPEPFLESITRLLKAGDRTPVRGMRALHWRLRNEAEIMPDALAILNEWDAKTRRREREMHNLRDKLNNRRKDIYRNFAYEVTNGYALIRIEDMQLAKMALVKLDDGGDNPMPQVVRNNRTRAALHELALYIQQGAVKTGAEFEKMPAMNSSVTCSCCGHLNFGLDLKDIYFRCEKCDSLHDQDENAANNFLQGKEFYIEEQLAA